MTDKNNNDFLSQFSESGKPKKPESFQEEVRVAVKKEKKEVKPIYIIIPCVVALIVALALVWMFVLPHIQMEDFIGKTQNDVAKWVTQNNIEKTGIRFDEEFSLDFEKGEIISQSPEGGKVKKNSKINFVISKGADPDEEIPLPNIENMNKSEIEDWIKINKLQGTKISTSYDENIPSGEVIKVDYGNVDKDHFTRGTTLKISVSKGPKPAEQVTVSDFTKKSYAEFEAWAKTNKITLNKSESYSDTVERDCVISQSVKSGKIEQGKTIDVVVSKGKGIKLPDFTQMNEAEFNEWTTLNSSFTNIKVTREIYSNSKAYISYQSVKAGTMVSSEDKVALHKNLGDGFYLEDAFKIVSGTTNYDTFKDWADNKAEEIGLSIDTHREYAKSDLPKGTILSVGKIYSGSDTYSVTQKLPLEVDITCILSDGTGAPAPEVAKTFTFDSKDKIDGKTYDEIAAYVEDNAEKISRIKVVGLDDETVVDSIDSKTTYSFKRFEHKDDNGITVKYEFTGSKIDVPVGAVLVIG